MRVNIQTNTRSGGTKIKPARPGIQRSVTPWFKSHVPTDLVAPSARMKLAQRPAVSSSVLRRPSRNPITSPNTIPSDSPFRKRQTTWSGGGAMPKSTRAASAIPISTRIPAARRWGGISAITRMPMNFAAV